MWYDRITKLSTSDWNKKVKKTFKKFQKGIDNGKKVWYNSRAAEKKGSERSLKIEQQERSTKHSMCERTDLVNQELIYTQQSKRS